MKTTLKRALEFICVLIILPGLASRAFTAAAQAPGTFTPTGNMITARDRHTATLLLNGKVLITGSSNRPAGAELYDPSTGTFTATGNMTSIRYGPSATLLADGRVLVAGGSNLGAAELYDPASGTFTATGSMVTTQNWHQATLLNNGKVLIAGGGSWCPNNHDGCVIVDRPELYDPATGAFTATGDYADKSGDPWFETYGLVGAPATLLPNGKVLIAAEPSAELYDPATGTFELTGQMTRGKHDHGSDSRAGKDRQPGWAIGGTATLLKNGKVLLAGGNSFEMSDIAEAELYDPSTGTFTATGSMINTRDGQSATLLPDGTVLIAGGQGWDCNDRFCVAVFSRADAELYDPSSGAFKSTGSMTARRSWHEAIRLNDGRVLVTGGASGSIGSAELYIPTVFVPAPVVSGMQFARTTVIAGTSYSVNVSGSNLTPQTFFDVRFSAPGITDSNVVLNWQTGTAASHAVPSGTAAGTWTINGVRAHEIETDHTGAFFPVTATITVSP